MRWRPIRESEEALVVHLDLAPDISREKIALDWLDESELERRDRFIHPGPRRRFTLCRAALRSLLCRELGCGNSELSFDASKFGKPFAKVGGTPSKIAFNVSHGGRQGLIAVAPRGRIGVDVEERRTGRDLDGYIATLFAPGERAEIEQAEYGKKLKLFYRLWTMKEALVKAVGTGLSLDTAEFEIPPAMVRGETVGAFSFPGTPSVRWRLEDIGNERYAAAMARELP